MFQTDGVFFSLLMFFNATNEGKEAINPHADGIKTQDVQNYYPCPKSVDVWPESFHKVLSKKLFLTADLQLL